MANDCQPGDYRPECYQDPGQGVGGENCGAGTHFDATQGHCVPDGATTGGEAACPEGQGRLIPGGPCVGGSSAGTTPSDPGGGDAWPSYFGPKALTFDFGAAPKFTPPQFKAPTLSDAQNEPGYAFARDEGQRALEQSAAGKGVLRTGGTLKDITAWGNKFAEQNYGNVFNRALSTFDRLYSGARDQWTGQMTEWQTNAAGKQRAGELGFNRAWDLYLQELERFKHFNPSASDLLSAELGSL